MCVCCIEEATGNSCQDISFQLAVEFVKFLSWLDTKDEEQAEKVIAVMAANDNTCQLENSCDGNFV